MISVKQKRHLRTFAHKLKPVVIVGDAGLSESVLREIDLTLEHHELIKIRINAIDREDRQNKLDTLLEHTGADLIQQIGHVVVIYRPAKQPRLQLP